MDNIILFYTNSVPINNKKHYYFDNIVVNWDDYKFETNKRYFDWFFPSKENLTQQTIDQFKNNSHLRKQVIKIVIRIISFFGYILEQKKDVLHLEQIKPLNRRGKGTTVGLFSPINYDRITQILQFLGSIDMELLSAIFFNIICVAMNSNNLLKQKTKTHLTTWMNTQPFLIKHIPSISPVPAKKEPCSDTIRGLDFTGNSCYMDSALLAIFAIPNKIITNHILDKNIRELKKEKNLWFKCNEEPAKDLRLRSDIQSSLKSITNYMRNIEKNPKNCSNLRRVIKNCSPPQAFYGTGMMDSGEFLTYLFNVFQVNIAYTQRTTYGTNDPINPNPDWTMTTNTKNEHDSPIIDIVSNYLNNLGPDKHNIKVLLRQVEDIVIDGWIYPRKKEIFTLVSSDLVIFKIQRLGQVVEYKNKKIKGKISEKFIKTYIIPTKTIKLKNDPDKKILNLSSIIIHNGSAHYTCVIKCGDVWLFYDDNPSGSKHVIKNIGSYENMLKVKPSPLTHGTVYLYTI